MDLKVESINEEWNVAIWFDLTAIVVFKPGTQKTKTCLLLLLSFLFIQRKSWALILNIASFRYCIHNISDTLHYICNDDVKRKDRSQQLNTYHVTYHMKCTVTTWTERGERSRKRHGCLNFLALLCDSGSRQSREWLAQWPLPCQLQPLRWSQTEGPRQPSQHHCVHVLFTAGGRCVLKALVGRWPTALETRRRERNRPLGQSWPCTVLPINGLGGFWLSAFQQRGCCCDDSKVHARALCSVHISRDHVDTRVCMGSCSGDYSDCICYITFCFVLFSPNRPQWGLVAVVHKKEA